MWKQLAIVLVCILLLQGCISNDDGYSNEQGGVEMSNSLLLAAERMETEVIVKLIADGADINLQDSQGRTAAMIATYNNDIPSVKALVDAGADINIQDKMKNNPFLYAGAEGYIEILRLTIDAGADASITNRYGGTALIPASEHGYIDVVEELLERTNINVNHVNNLGWTALLEAIILNDGDEKQQQTVQLLIDHGADVNLADNNRVTPLQHAKKMNFKSTLR